MQNDHQANPVNLSTLSSSTKKTFPFLYWAIGFHIIAFLLCLIAMLFDDRQLTGINVWIKPTKFWLSTAIFLLTASWYLLVYPFKLSTKVWIANSFTFLLLLENSIISIQAGRGIYSHYNSSDFLNVLLFQTMGIAIGIVTLLTFWLFLKSFSFKLQLSTPMKWGIRIAWFTFLFASFIGGAMIAQMKHNVGIPDGGDGLLFLNWSREAGDLRVAHFFGLHAIQIIPIGIYWLSGKVKNATVLLGSSIGFALLYLAWVLFVFYEAILGKAFL